MQVAEALEIHLEGTTLKVAAEAKVVHIGIHLLQALLQIADQVVHFGITELRTPIPIIRDI